MGLAEEGFCEANNGEGPILEGEGSHCPHWWDCEPCHYCGFDGGGDDCDCPRHNPSLYDTEGMLI